MEANGYPLIKIFKKNDSEVQSENPLFDFSWKIGLPVFKNINGPMKDLYSIRYEKW
jgi:hypothetical protein